MPKAMSPAGLRYTKRFAGWMSLYVVTVLAAPLAFPRVPHGPAQIAVAVVPALAIVGVIWTIAQYLMEETDEYVRMRLAQAVLVGTGVTLAVCSVWGFLEGYGLAPHLPAYDVVPLFFGAWGISQLIRRVLGR